MLFSKELLANGSLSKSTEFPSIAVIILMWNRWEDTIECLESVFQQNYPNYQVILVDNGSAEESLKKIREYCNGLVKINSSFVDFDDSNKPIQVVEVGRKNCRLLTFRVSTVHVMRMVESR